MKKIILITTLLLLALISYSQEDTTKVVINHKMIEKFNNCVYPENAITFNQMIEKYSVDEMKVILSLYETTDLVLTDTTLIDKRLSEIKLEE
jgi:hypothetical protein